MIETDVLVAGCGPAGLTAALALARSSTEVLAVSKHRQLAPTPRADRTNQRSFEILREFGVEQQALGVATSYDDISDEIFLRSLTGPEFGRCMVLTGSDGQAWIAAAILDAGSPECAATGRDGSLTTRRSGEPTGRTRTNTQKGTNE